MNRALCIHARAAARYANVNVLGSSGEREKRGLVVRIRSTTAFHSGILVSLAVAAACE